MTGSAGSDGDEHIRSPSGVAREPDLRRQGAHRNREWATEEERRSRH